MPRIFMRGEPDFDEILDLARQLGGGRTAWLEDEERLDQLGAHRIGNADCRGKGHGGMFHKAILDFAGSDAVAGRGDEIVGTTDEPEIAVLVLTREIAGQEIIAREFLGGFPLAAPLIY